MSEKTPEEIKAEADAAEAKAAQEAKEREEAEAKAKAEHESAKVEAAKNQPTPQQAVPDTKPTDEHVVDATGKEALLEQHAAVDRENEERNKANEAGQQVILDKIREDAKLAHENSEKAPTTGKARDLNTPRIDEHGNKIWG